MRIWSLHPKYLDAKGLVALWRETLLAKNVLMGKTKGYKNHPQLTRFKENANPAHAINQYLDAIYVESKKRGYHFNKEKIDRHYSVSNINVTKGQIQYEKNHLLRKLEIRDQQKFQVLSKETHIELHPLFYAIEGEIEKWEIL